MDFHGDSDDVQPAGRSNPTLSLDLAAHPTHIREYRLLEQIGAGGMGTVYRAEHTKLKRIVALKLLPPSRVQDARAIARFEREMEAIGRLDHPSVVRATDAGEYGGSHYLVMEYVDGIDLANLSQQEGPLPVADACELIRQSAVGLQYIHEHGLVHRDVKPSNLMLTSAGQVKILDLGLALLRSDELRGPLTDSGQAMGTADYMAPEQAIDSRQVDIRADIYSLGCTLYRLLAGRAPFAAPEYPGVVERILAHINDPVPSLRSFRTDLPVDLEAVVDQMLAKKPGGRFTTPREVAQSLEPFAAGSNLHGLTRRVVIPAGVGDRNRLASTPNFVSLPRTETWSGHALGERHADDGATRRWNRRMLAVVGAGTILMIAAVFVAYQTVIRIQTNRPVAATNSPLGTHMDTSGSGSESIASDQARPATVSAGPASHPPGDEAGGDAGPRQPPAAATEPARAGLGASQPAPASLAAVPQISMERAVVRLPEIAHLQGHTGPIQCLVFSWDGKMLATGSNDQTVRIWDVQRSQLLATLRGYPNAVNSLAFSPDGRLLAWVGGLGYDQCVILYDQFDGRVLTTLRCQETVTPTTIRCLAFSSDGQFLAAGGDGPVRIWNVREQKLLHELKWQQVFPSYVPSLAFDPDGATLAACCHGGSTDVQIAETVRTWIVATGQPGDVLVGNTGTFGLSHDDVRGVLLYSPDGRLLVRVTSGESGFGGLARGGSVKVWSRQEGSKSYSYRIPGGNVYAAYASRSGEVLVAVAAGESKLQLPFGKPGAESPDGNSHVPAVVSDPTAVAVCGKEAFRRSCLATGHDGPVISLAISPDAKWLATGSKDNTVKVWDLTLLAWLKE
jgi:serine/threonine protein kinase/WD40 repeat protein